jgi:hypothetical protein
MLVHVRRANSESSPVTLGKMAKTLAGESDRAESVEYTYEKRLILSI